MNLNILVLDDNLDTARLELEKALALYLGPGVTFNVPDFFKSPCPSDLLELPAVSGSPAATITFRANKRRDKSGAEIVRQINSGDYDNMSWDAVILDNNWAGAESESSGCRLILPALLARDAFKASKPEYLLLTWHFDDPAYHRIVSDTLLPYRQVANVTPMAKGTAAALSGWFGQMLRLRLQQKCGIAVSLTVPTGEPLKEVLRFEDGTKSVITITLSSKNEIKFQTGTKLTEFFPFKGSSKGRPAVCVATLMLIDLGIECDGAKDVAVLLDRVRDPSVRFGDEELKGKNKEAREGGLRIVDSKNAGMVVKLNRIKNLLSTGLQLRENIEIVSHSCSDLKRSVEKNKYATWPSKGGGKESSNIWVFREALKSGLLKLVIA